MTTAEILEMLAEELPDCLTADGFDDAIIGIAEGASRQTVVCYDYAKCIQILMEQNSMDEAEAEESLEFNTVGAYVGELTPLFIHDWRKH